MRCTLIIGIGLLLTACSKSPTGAAQKDDAAQLAIQQAAAQRIDAPSVPLSPQASLGKKIFFDPTLSASGKMACASCHNPKAAYAPANALETQLGGPELNRQGVRAVPSLTYLERTPHFKIIPDMKIDLDDGGTNKAPRPMVPLGGLDWDGRATSLADQASGPLFDPREMANEDPKVLLARLKAASYASEIIAQFGSGIFDRPEAGIRAITTALERFQLEDRSFHLYTSKFDYYLAGRVQLTEQESRGLKLFDDPKKGNCAACHLDRPTKNRMAPAFTDYQFEALGAPRNLHLDLNVDRAYFDEGLCGPNRKDKSSETSYCGMFKTPSLRNVATRQVFFHNGVFHSLEDVVRFYAERDTRPEKWYPQAKNGDIELFNDLPPNHRSNVDVADPPFNRQRGEQPALNDAEIKDVVAFLNTLTDGFISP